MVMYCHNQININYYREKRTKYGANSHTLCRCVADFLTFQILMHIGIVVFEHLVINSSRILKSGGFPIQIEFGGSLVGFGRTLGKVSCEGVQIALTSRQL